MGVNGLINVVNWARFRVRGQRSATALGANTGFCEFVRCWCVARRRCAIPKGFNVNSRGCQPTECVPEIFPTLKGSNQSLRDGWCDPSGSYRNCADGRELPPTAIHIPSCWGGRAAVLKAALRRSRDGNARGALGGGGFGVSGHKYPN